MNASPVEYDARLVEEAVLRRIAGEPFEADLRARRDAIYSIPDPDEREQAFSALHREWFASLELDRPIRIALAESPVDAAQVERVIVTRAAKRHDEGAELYVRPFEPRSPRRTLLIAIRVERLLDPAAALALLRGELLHVADMLDPAFGYEPSLPAATAGPAHDRLLRDRYRLLWNVTIDGRLARRGVGAESTRARRFQEFVDLFAELGESAAHEFSRFFDEWPRTHAELVAFAENPPCERSASPRGRCALCSFPTPRLETPEPDSLVNLILRDFPAWRPGLGICPRCLELYRGTAQAPARRTAPRNGASHQPG